LGFAITHKDSVKNRKLPSVTEELGAFTCCPYPYRWMREENLREILEAERFKLRPSDDPGRANGWVYEPDRQQVLLSRFWGKLEKGKSLIFFYCNKANPLSVEQSRILLGIGRIKDVGEQLYFGKKKGFMDDYPIWSRSVSQNYPKEGVRVPYHEYLSAGLPIESILCPINSSAFADFSYVGEHVSDDVALSVVERLIRSIQQVRDDGFVLGDWGNRLAWLNDVLQDLRCERGVFPGIGSMLQYLGFQQGTSYQRFVLAPLMREQKNPWAHVERILNGKNEPENDGYREGLLLARVTWQKLGACQNLLRKLARFELTAEQVARRLCRAFPRRGSFVS